MTAPPPIAQPRSAPLTPFPPAAPAPQVAPPDPDADDAPLYRTTTFAMPAAAPPLSTTLAPAPTPATMAEAWFRRLRALRAEAQDLRAVLDDVRRGDAPLARYVEYIGKTCADIDELIAGLDDDDDCIRHVRNAWEQMRTCAVMRAPDQVLDPQLQMQLLNLLDGQARRIVYWTSYRTIPNRLMHWLREAQPGYAIPFHAVFEDELPDAEDRQRVLNHLACTPEALKDVGGLVDPESGLVYRYDPSARRRVRSAATLVLVLAALTAVVAFAGPEIVHTGGADGTTAVPPRSLLLGWAAVLVGTVTHVGVAAAKRMRTVGANPAVLPVGRMMLLLNAKEGLILLRTGLALLGFFALALATTVPAEAQLGPFLLNAFLVGYSLDSVVELFGAGMDQRAAALQAGLKARLGTGGA
jgi:hypothetical protein